jgi:hypothetical protein
VFSRFTFQSGPAVVIAMIGPLVGGVQAAFDAFLERLPGRGITFAAYGKQSETAVTHLQLTEASMVLDEIHFRAEREASLADEKADNGDEWTLHERARQVG